MADQPNYAMAGGEGDWFEQAKRTGAPSLDVRPLLAVRQDPFARVMDMANGVPADGLMVLEAPFDPVPLRRALAGMGFVSQGRQVAPGHWRICFRRETLGMKPAPSISPGACWQDKDGWHLDVRGLMPPQPLTRTLAILDSGETETLLLHIEREPVLLYPELEARGWKWEPLTDGMGDPVLFLRRCRLPP